MQSSKVKITDKIVRKAASDGTHLNDYLIIKQIGEGPYSKIKLVKDLANQNQLYAMKKFTLYLLIKKTRMIRDKDGKNKYVSVVDDVQAETALMLPLDHPNVIKLHEVMRTEGNEKLYLIMQYCILGEISAWDSKKHQFKTRQEVLDPRKLTQIIIGILKGLQYLHNQNIVHRDLKPGNILLTGDYTPKIIDFGRAVKLNQSSQLLRGSEGTYHFMAPQMLSQKQKQGYDAKKSDIWSFGVTLFCMVTLQLPFDVEPIMKLFEAIQVSKFKYPQNHNIPSHVVQCINGCIVHDCKKRISIQKMLSICENFLSSLKN